MSDLSRVIIGNVVLSPGVIKKFLAKSYYFLNYAPEEERLTFNVNHDRGGEVLFEIESPRLYRRGLILFQAALVQHLPHPASGHSV